MGRPRRPAIARALSALVAGACLCLGAAATPATVPPAPAWRTDAEWSRAFDAARRADAGFRVESIDEFERITSYYAGLLGDGTTVHAFRTASGELIRCVDVASQRAFATNAPAGTAPPAAPLQPPRTATGRVPAQAAGAGGLGRLFGLDGSRDADGAVRACPALSFPKRIPELAALYRFRRLADIFQKDPGGRRLPPPGSRDARAGEARTAPAAQLSGASTAAAGRPVSPPANAPSDHEYAHAYDYVNNTGSQADFNLWSPFVQQDDEFSLAQLWVTRGNYNDNSLQTVEAGWQVCRLIYGDSMAHFFIYSTSAAYASGSGCYNLDCNRFVQTDSSVVIGGSFTSYSAIGGAQFDITVLVYRDPASQNWWLKLGDTWVGYYPDSLYNAAGLAAFSDEIDFGGEIVNDSIGAVHTTTQMGSGRFPAEGWQHAAYIKRIQYWDTAGNGYNAGSLTPSATDHNQYDIALASSSDANWSDYFYFGGPGGSAAGCSYATQPASADVPPAGGNGAVTIEASDPGCAWAGTVDAGWIHLSGASSGNGNGSLAYTVDSNPGAARSGKIAVAGLTTTIDQAGTSAGAYSRWIAAVIHKDVPAKNARYRSDVSVLNPSGQAANVQFRLHTTGTVVTGTAGVGAGGQGIFPDIAGQLGVTADSGALEVTADQPFFLFGRTYNQVDASHTFGQDYEGEDPATLLGAGDSAWLPQLTENANYRANVGVANTGTAVASVTLTLFDGQGHQLWSDTRSYQPGEFFQYQQPYLPLGGTANGYARVTVVAGAGVLATASVLDQRTNDPTTIVMQR